MHADVRAKEADLIDRYTTATKARYAGLCRGICRSRVSDGDRGQREGHRGEHHFRCVISPTGPQKECAVCTANVIVTCSLSCMIGLMSRTWVLGIITALELSAWGRSPMSVATEIKRASQGEGIRA
jgi:hypothetical protein